MEVDGGATLCAPARPPPLSKGSAMTQSGLKIDELGIRRTLDADYDAVLERVPGVLQREGFGVLTEIDVKQTLKHKIGVDFRRYKILGACNPILAHKVLEQEPQIGLLLPCNVVVYEIEGGKTVVAAFDPLQVVGTNTEGPLRGVAEDVRARLGRAVSALE